MIECLTSFQCYDGIECEYDKNWCEKQANDHYFLICGVGIVSHGQTPFCAEGEGLGHEA